MIQPWLQFRLWSLMYAVVVAAALLAIAGKIGWGQMMAIALPQLGPLLANWVADRRSLVEGRPLSRRERRRIVVWLGVIFPTIGYLLVCLALAYWRGYPRWWWWSRA